MLIVSSLGKDPGAHWLSYVVSVGPETVSQKSKVDGSLRNDTKVVLWHTLTQEILAPSSHQVSQLPIPQSPGPLGPPLHSH